MLSDYLSSVQAKTFSKMSGIELTDIQIPGTSLDANLATKKGQSESKGPDSNLNSGYDDMDGFQKLGPACGLYNQRWVTITLALTFRTQVVIRASILGTSSFSPLAVPFNPI